MSWEPINEVGATSEIAGAGYAGSAAPSNFGGFPMMSPAGSPWQQGDSSSLGGSSEENLLQDISSLLSALEGGQGGMGGMQGGGCGGSGGCGGGGCGGGGPQTVGGPGGPGQGQWGPGQGQWGQGQGQGQWGPGEGQGRRDQGQWGGGEGQWGRGGPGGPGGWQRGGGGGGGCGCEQRDPCEQRGPASQQWSDGTQVKFAGDPHDYLNGTLVNNWNSTQEVMLDGNNEVLANAGAANTPVQNVTVGHDLAGINADTPVEGMENGKLVQLGTAGQMGLANGNNQGQQLAAGQTYSFYNGEQVSWDGNGTVTMTQQ